MMLFLCFVGLFLTAYVAGNEPSTTGKGIFLSEPENKPLESAATITYNCKVEIPNPTYAWLKDSNDITQLDNPRHNSFKGTLSIDTPQMEDEGKYRCMVTSEDGDIIISDSVPAEEISNGQESIPPQHSESNSRRHNVLTQLLGAVRPRESENPAPASFVGQNNWTLLLTRFLHWSDTVYTYIACFILNVLALYIGIFLCNEISEQLAFKQPTSQPDGPTNQPDEPTNQPDGPTSQPDEPTSQPDEPTNQPDEPTNQPDEPTNQQDEPTSQPDEPTSQQNSQDINPDCQDESEIENRENHRRNGRQKKATNTKVTPTSTFLEAAEVKLTAPPVYNTSYSSTGRRHDLSNYRVNVPPVIESRLGRYFAMVHFSGSRDFIAHPTGDCTHEAVDEIDLHPDEIRTNSGTIPYFETQQWEWDGVLPGNHRGTFPFVGDL